jgi:hypothetical protein
VLKMLEIEIWLIFISDIETRINRLNRKKPLNLRLPPQRTIKSRRETSPERRPLFLRPADPIPSHS